MANNYIYKENRVITKKMAGIYDSEKHTVEVDGTDYDVLSELSDFDGAIIEVVVKIKEETDLSEE